MWPISLLRCLKSDSPGTQRQRGRRPGRHQSQRFVPRLEALEDRALPSTFTVLNLADSGASSLRQAILDANTQPGLDVIRFAPAARDGTITLTSGQLSITDDLTLDGPGAGRLAVSGNDASRVFQISGGVNVTMDGLTVTRGRADNGGAIHNGGTLTLTHVVVSDNRAVGAAGAQTGGGGIYNARGSLSLSHVHFSHNQAFGTPGQIARGGAVFNDDGAATVDHSTFSHNLVVGGLVLG